MTQPPNGDPFPPPGYPGQPQPPQPYGGTYPPQPPPAGPYPPQPPRPYPGAYQPQPYQGTYPPQAPQPYQGAYPPQPGAPQSGAYPPPADPAPRRRRRGALIASIALVLAVLLCAGGGTTAFFMLRDTEQGEGAANPTEAVEGFLTAVYRDQDADKAAALVCSAARDRKQIADRVKEIKKLGTTYKNPRFTWSPLKLDDQSAERAVVSTRVTMATADEKVSYQQLKFVVVQRTGWWVCEVS